MDIPNYLISEIKAGNAVLFFGAGVSYGARNNKNETVPLGNSLRDMISDKFLGGKYKDRPLDIVAGMAVSESDLHKVQDFIKNIFMDYEPAEYHKIIPTFRWRALYTTNYDLIIEKAYDSVFKKVQNLVPFISDKDKIWDKLRDENALEYIKLHGCITKSEDYDCPLILTRNQYGSHKTYRERLYGKLYDVAHEHPIIFIGHSMQDTDLLEVIAKLKDNKIQKPNFYVLLPKIDEIENRYLQHELNINSMVGTFEEFICQLDKEISSDFRGLPSVVHKNRHPFFDVICNTKVPISEELAHFIKNETEYIYRGFKTEYANPSLFYKGIDCGWGAIEQNLDVERKITDKIIIDTVFEQDYSNGNNVFDFVLINAPAGAGKSVLLKRLAWQISTDYNRPCIYLKDMGRSCFDSIKELLEISEKHIYFFVDNAANHVRFFSLLQKIAKEHLNKLTIIATERTNEWNMVSDDLTMLPIRTYNIENLDNTETQKLLDLLDKYNSLGELAKYERKQQIDILVKHYGKQLLVALYESTKGKNFEEIINDEYNNIFPEKARHIYLVICILNRLNIPIRAGLINSIFGINFTDFKRKFLNPLEEIVIVKEDRFKDLYYIARHPYIAQIVFEQVLTKVEDRFNRFIEVLKELNVVFESDRKAFREMIKANHLMDLFNQSHDMISQIYDYAKEHSPDDPFVLQQMAIYEFKRPNGNLIKAREYVVVAENLDSRNTSIMHTKAELYLKLAETTKNSLEFERLLAEVSNSINQIERLRQPDTYSYSTLIKIELLKLKRCTEFGTATFDIDDTKINNIVEKTEKILYKSLQLFPNNYVLLKLQAEYANLIGNEEKYIDALKRAFESNNRNKYIAQNLVRYYQDIKRFDKANMILDKAMMADHADIRLKYLKAKNLYLMDEELNRETILYLLEKCSLSNETNYDSRILYGRELFISREYEKSKEVFLCLKNVLIGEDIKNQIQYRIDEKYLGYVGNVQDGYIFIKADGNPIDIFAHKKDNDKVDFDKLKIGDRVSFNVAFTFKGSIAMNIEKY